MKIAFYCPNKPLGHPEPSGDQSIARGLVQALENEGHAVQEMSTFRARWFWTQPGGLRQAMRGCMEALRRSLAWRPELWLTYHTYYKAPDVIGPWLSRLLKIPYVLFQPMYGTRRRRDAETRPGFYWNRLALRGAWLAITNNANDRAALERIVPLKRLTYLAPGIFPEMFSRDDAAGRLVRARYGVTDTDRLVLTVARFRPGVKWESLRFLFRSLALLDAERLSLRLMVVGDGPLEAAVRREASACLAGRVVFPGRVPRRELYAYYSAADLFAFPGIGESLGMVYLEAQACGLAVVALREGGVDQVVADGVTGVLVPARDPAAYADAVSALIREEGLRQAMGLEAARFVRRHRNLHRQGRYLAHLLASLVSGPKRPLPR
ncbi:glycosyltransferase family 4 protein [Desulfosoma sp.]